MFTDKFIIKNHIFTGQHVRQCPGSLMSGSHGVYRLHAKQYVSYGNQDPLDGDITIIALHGVGMFKELYEPMWEDLCQISERQGLRIRSIWMVDASDHGHSAVLNEGMQSENVNHSNYALDVLAMINMYRDEMPSPLVGFGHSLGAMALVQLSNMHPQLFSSLILVDPLFEPETAMTGVNMPAPGDVADLIWKDDSQAMQYARTRFARWDPRVLQRWKQFGLRGLPSRNCSDVGRVKLRTTKDIHDWEVESLGPDSLLSLSREHNKWLQNDGSFQPFKALEADKKSWPLLSHLRPTTHYLFPLDSPFSTEEETRSKITQTGRQLGASRGMTPTRVTNVLCAGGHMAPMEKPRECAVLICERLVDDRTLQEEKDRNRSPMMMGESTEKIAQLEHGQQSHLSLKAPRAAHRAAKL